MAVSGHELGGKIKEALNLPDGTIWFELRCHVNGLASIRCEYYPEKTTLGDDDKLITELAEYRLEKIEHGDP